jgi:SAM-dependent methyltransferase
MDNKEFYNLYQYPKLSFFTSKSKKRYLKLIKEIINYTDLDLNSLKTKTILDAGCGTGEKSCFFANYSKKVVGIDFSKNQIYFAKKLKNIQKIKNLNFFIKDLEKDNLESLGQFDIIFVIGSLPAIKQSYKVFKKLLPLLKENGIIVLGLYHKYSRLRYRINRFLLRIFSKDFYKLEHFLFNNLLTRNIRKAPKNTLYDRYLLPFENYHTLSQIKSWFLKNNIKLLKYSSNVEGVEILKIFSNKTFFFVSGKK